MVQENKEEDRRNLKKQLDETLNKFETISLEEMNNVALLKRVETKFIMNMKEFLKVLNQLQKYYKILSINENRINKYKTMYYDTPNFSLFRAHHNGELNRYKIRNRTYQDSNLSYMEIKFKDNKDRTIKDRIKTKENLNLDDKSSNFVKNYSTYEPQNLIPALINSYTRITLVSKKDIERLTIDIDLKFSEINSQNSVELNKIVIAEIKQDKFSYKSKFIEIMHKNSIRSTSFSKYCVGLSLLKKGQLKTNNFKEKILLVNKLSGGELL